jgi:hypothetical protein
MNASNSGCLLIFRGTDWYQGLSPGQVQQVFDHWIKWFSQLKSEGTAIAGNPLEPQGKIVLGANGRGTSRRWTRRSPSRNRAPACRTVFASKSDPWCRSPIAAVMRAEAQLPHA